MQICRVHSLALCLLGLLIHTSSSFKRVCYFTNWSRDLQQAGGRFRLTDVEPFLCTHLVYAFAAVKPDNSSFLPIVTQLMEGREEELQRYRDFNALKLINLRLKTLLSVGGSIQANGNFVQIVSSDDKRKQFATNAVTYLRTWGFDGLDIDWEYPGDPPDTKANFVLLLAELRAAFEGDAMERRLPPLLLSVAAPVSEAQMKAGYDVPKVSSLVDFINLMAYDFHGSWNSITSFNSPLYGRTGDPRYSPDLSVKGTEAEKLVLGVAGYGQSFTLIDPSHNLPLSLRLSVRTGRCWRGCRRAAEAEKLVLGMAGYGQSFTLLDPVQHGVGAPTNGSGTPGRWRRMAGQLSYYEVCEYMQAGGVEVWDDLQRVPYVSLGDQWVGYDDPHSVKDKVDFAIEHSLGGVMLWSLDMDDFRGAYCDKGRYPLLTAMVEAIGEKMPDVTVRLTDTVTWPHPDSVTMTSPTTLLSTTPPSTPAASTKETVTTTPTRTKTVTASSTSSPSPSSSSPKTTSSPSTSTTTTTTTTTSTTPSTTPTTPTPTPQASVTQKAVVISKNRSHAALHMSCRLLLTFAFLLLHLMSF